LGPVESWSQSLRTATSILLHSPVPIVLLWGEDGIMLYNDAYSELAGKRHPELLGSKVREGWPEVADFNDNVMKVVLAGKTLAYRDQELTLHRHGRPEQVWMNLDYSPVLDADGVPAGVIAIVVETTERVQAERRVAAERERLAEMFEQAPGFMALLKGPEHVFELANPSFIELVGNPDLVGKPVATALPEIAEQGFVEILDQVYRTGEAFVAHSREVWLESHQCRVFVDFVYQPIRDGGDKVSGIFVQGTDVTQRARAESLRNAQNRMLELSVEDAPLADLLEMLMQSVEAQSEHGMLGSILLLDPDGIHLRDGAAPSLPAAYRAAIDGIEIGDGVGSCGTAAFTGEPVFVEDIATDPLWADFRDLALSHGLRACWSTPILSSAGKVLGTFALYYREPRGPTADDRALIEFVTRTAAIAIERDVAKRERNALEQRSHALLEGLPAAVYTTDAEGRITFFNHAAEEMWGRAPRLGEDRWSGAARLYAPDGAPIAHEESPMAISLRSGTPLRGREAVIERPDGSRVNFIPFPTPLRDASGELTGGVNMLVDITDRKAGELALEEQRRTLETLNRTGAAISGELDLDNVVQLVTDAGVELTGAQFGAFFYNSVNEAGESLLLYTISGVDRAHFEKFPNPRNTAIFAPTFAGEGVVRSDDILADPRYGKNKPHRGMPDGHLPVRSYLAVPVRSRSGDVLGGLFFGHPETGQFIERHEKLIVGIAAQAAIAIDNARLYEAAQKEVAERRSAEEALRRTSDEFETLADNIPSLCWMAYANGDIFWYNRRWYEYTGTDPESQVGWGWESVHDPEILPAVSERWRHSLSEGVPFEMTFPLKGADGIFRPFLTRIVPIHGEDGKIVRWFGTNVDVSEQVETGRQLELALAGTEALLHEVNHRVKNSLQIVTSLLMLQANKAADPELKTALLEARSRISVVASLHQRLYSANEHDRVEFGSYVGELASETVRSLGGEGRIALDVDASEKVVMPLGKAVPLALVVSELLTNAIKYAYPEQGRGKVTLRVSREDNSTLIEVVDDGSGLPADFDIEKPEGLGMRIVVALVRQVRGILTTLEQDRGAGFRIEVPADRSGE
jgi:PAS domain S-box-containing protein